MKKTLAFISCLIWNLTLRYAPKNKYGHHHVLNGRHNFLIDLDIYQFSDGVNGVSGCYFIYQIN